MEPFRVHIIKDTGGADTMGSEAGQGFSQVPKVEVRFPIVWLHGCDGL